jgi:hypothetical protein
LLSLFVFGFSPLLPLLEVVQRAHPSYNPKGVCLRQSKSWPRSLGPIAAKNSSKALQEEFQPSSLQDGEDVPSIYNRLCNGYTPLIIQKGCARASQKAGFVFLFTRRNSSIRHSTFSSSEKQCLSNESHLSSRLCNGHTPLIIQKGWPAPVRKLTALL